MNVILANLREIMMQLLLRRDKEAYWREKWEQYKEVTYGNVWLIVRGDTWK